MKKGVQDKKKQLVVTSDTFKRLKKALAKVANLLREDGKIINDICDRKRKIYDPEMLWDLGDYLETIEIFSRRVKVRISENPVCGHCKGFRELATSISPWDGLCIFKETMELTISTKIIKDCTQFHPMKPFR